ncbi:nucleoside 2-deoxyribosyltransferase domain-containing protein [Paenibacillus amylolyticus]|nr:nucleoside 2-deoxyribosyltransferase domain-containing protein [Paenibacillus amylolyticus]WFR60925.1 nucleoside 2-deoxyribosyltransferase domain-containing protein [Paenibacillus amylolyticus]
MNSLHKNVYLSGSTLTSETRWKLEQLNAIMEGNFLTTHLPHRDVELQSTNSNSESEIFELCNRIIKDCDLFIAVIDKNDNGTSNTLWEIGYAYALNKPIICLHEDSFFNERREGQRFLWMNSLIMCQSVEELKEQLALILANNSITL